MNKKIAAFLLGIILAASAQGQTVSSNLVTNKSTVAGATATDAFNTLGGLAVPCTTTVKGLVPTPPNDSTKYLGGDCLFHAIPAGAGTVTSVGVTTANGVSASVSNPTTTPLLTFTLGAITPSSVAATGTVTGSNLSGTNTGNITLGTASGLSLAGQVLSLGLSSTSTTGALSSTDWNTFNGKGSGTVTTTGSPTSGQYTKFSGASSITGQTGIPNTDVTGLGTMSTQNANAVAISGGTADGIVIGGSVPGPATFADAGGGNVGLVFRSVPAAPTFFAAVYPTGVTPGNSNYILLTNATGTTVNFNAATSLGMLVGGTGGFHVTSANTTFAIPVILPKGTTAAGTAPLQATLATAALLTTPAAGMVEWDSAGAMYYTPSTIRFPFFPMTAVGDLIAGGTSGTPTRLPVGADTFVLTADSTQPLGVKWAAGGGGSGTVTTTGSPSSGQMTKFSGATSITTAVAGTDYSAGTSALATGILKSTTTTGALTIAIAADFPTLNQNTSGSAASFTGALAGDVTGTQGATVVGKINGVALSGLATGILKNTTTTGVPSIAVANTDYLPVAAPTSTGLLTFGTATSATAGVASTPALSLTGTPFAGTGTTSVPLFYFNNAVTQPTTLGTGGTYLGINGSGAAFLDFHVNGGASVFSVGSGGGTVSASSIIAAGNVSGLFSTGVMVGNGAANGFAISSTTAATGTADLFITRKSAANRRSGQADAAAPVAQFDSVQSVVAGTSNTAGADRTFQASLGTGTGTSGSIFFDTAPAGTTGSTQNALSHQLTIGPTGVTVAGTLTATASSANAIQSATTTVNTSSATAPSSGQVLTATSSTAATWQTPGSGGVAIGSISTNWYPAGSVTGELGTSATARALVTGTLYYQPFFLTKSVTFTGIGMLANSTVAGTLVMGIYNDSGSMSPTGSPIANSNSTSVTLVASTFASYAFSSAITLTPGIYWLAFSTSGSTQFTGTTLNNAMGVAMGINGTPTNTKVAAPQAGWSQTFGYSATLPSVGTLTAVAQYSIGTPYIFLQAQ